MAGTNDFKAFATDANANVTSQEEWETLTALKKGFSSGKASSAQVSKALRQPSTMAAVLGQFIANAELDALDDGDVDGLVAKLATAITTNLGLGEGSALPVGVPVPWPSATPPTGWLKCNGAAFSAEEYPELAKVYPTNKLPDLRGEFIRGWDDGRGVDAGRQLLSSQGDAIRNIEGFADGGIGMSFDAIRGAFYDAGTRSARMPNNTTDIGKTDDLGFDASRVVPTANENRPRNIAFNYIVRAA
ncbi:phage tail protein [Escherichia coli]|uniref:phage tail protein n=1 Tax=Escherichia coli TaxID=562 RepID=UPI00248FAFBC|nr:phage tail protein [Escherichia coli]